MGASGIEFLNVTYTYPASTGRGGGPALSAITLQVLPGEFVGLIGMNGSGKSTLIRLINGLLLPGSGKVYVNNMDTADPDKIMEIRRRAGMVFQNPDNQLICPLVEEEIAFGLENIGLPLPEVQLRIDWALQAVGLENLKHSAPHLLSGGQKQKVALASVLAMMPDYLLLDEPTSMLDPYSRCELLHLLRKLNRKKAMTIIMTSHEPQDMLQLDRLIVLEQGKIYLQGSPVEIFSQADKLAAIGLEIPAVWQLRTQLAAAGISIADDITTISGLVDSICLE